MVRAATWVSLVPLGLLCAVGCLVATPLGDFDAEGDNSTAASDGGGDGGANGSANAGATSGGAGAPGSGPCETNAECVERANNQPARCLEGECISLRTGECQLAYDSVTASQENPIYIGAFAILGQLQPERSATLAPFRLAWGELSGNANGGLLLSDGAGNRERRPIVMVVCDNAPDNIDPAMTHLVKEVGVHAVLATLLPGDLRHVFEQTYEDNDNVFFLSPVGATDIVATLDDEDRVWTMLGQPKDLVPVYRHLVEDLVEPYLQDVRGVDSRPIRVALLKGEDAFSLELSKLVERELVFNGMPVSENDAEGNYIASTLNGIDSVQDATQEIFEFVPDLVISTAGSDVTRASTGLIHLVETGWRGFAALDGANVPPLPFYVLSPFNAGDLAALVDLLETEMLGADSTPTERFVGVTAAGAEDRSLQNDFAIDLADAFPDDPTNPDTGNYYDAFYFLSYAITGSGVPEPNGDDIARGMRRLLSGEPYEVGFLSIPAVNDALKAEDTTIELHGTLGPPSFDLDSGVRIDPGAIYCFEGSTGVVNVYPEALRYVPATETFEGDFECFDNFVR